MGAAAIALIPLQLYLIPKFQKCINTLQREEVQAVRQISQRVGDVVAGASEIHGHDTSQYELADFSQRRGACSKRGCRSRQTVMSSIFSTRSSRS